ncbi:GNAT family N-acetyltransferase [Kribbella sp. NPDC003505]|uniref:GNAT family N-acetyltransferase n=1 Tax=Kribbella sp. NPDC003505 TaxID=3154448 RepID=UPI0033BDA765
MRIRPAGSTDAVDALLEELGYPQPDPAVTAARLRAWADDPAGAAYVAEADNRLLGVIAVHVIPFFEREGTWARIVALVVSSRARRHGVGTLLLEAAESFAASRGCLRLEVTSSNHRAPAHTFYQSHGYTDQSTTSSRFLRTLT